MMFWAGFSRTKMCLSKEAGMSGYIARETAEYEVHDPLYVQAAAFSVEKQRTILLINLDLVGVDMFWLNRMTQDISDICGVLKEQILISCTHTHSGPATLSFFGMDAVSTRFMKELCQESVRCARDAIKRQTPCRIEYGSAACDAAVNRVLMQKWSGTRTDSWENTDWDHLGNASYHSIQELLEKGYESERFVDEEVLALKVTGLDGSAKGILVNYACHPVCLEADNVLYSRDYIHDMEERLQEDFGKVPVLFLTGCAGDINPRFRGSFDESRIIGRTVAESVCMALEDKNVNVQDFLLNVQSIPFTFHIRSGLDEVVLNERKNLYKEGIDKSQKAGNRMTEKVYSAYYAWADEMLRRLQNEELFLEAETTLKVVTIGEFKIVALPFEVFHEIGKEIKKVLGTGRTMVSAYTDGEFGYFVSETLAPYAKYEGMEAFKFSGWPGPIAEEDGKKLVEIIQMNQQVL